MRARRLTTILPAMTLVEAIEPRRIHRVAGRTGDRTAFADPVGVSWNGADHVAKALQDRSRDRERES